MEPELDDEMEYEVDNDMDNETDNNRESQMEHDMEHELETDTGNGICIVLYSGCQILGVLFPILEPIWRGRRI